MIKFFALALLFSQTAYAVKKEWSTRLQQQKVKVGTLRGQVLTLESSLSERNQQYIEGVRQSQKVGAVLGKVNKELAEIQDSMAIESRKMSVILRHAMVQSLDPQEALSSRDLYLKQLMTQGLLEKKQRYKTLQQDLISLQSEARLLQERLRDYQENEETLRSLIANLESEKGQITRKFVDGQRALRELASHLAQNQAVELLRGEGDEEEGAPVKMESPLQLFSALKEG